MTLLGMLAPQAESALQSRGRLASQPERKGAAEEFQSLVEELPGRRTGRADEGEDEENLARASPEAGYRSAMPVRLPDFGIRDVSANEATGDEDIAANAQPADELRLLDTAEDELLVGEAHEAEPQPDPRSTTVVVPDTPRQQRGRDGAVTKDPAIASSTRPDVSDDRRALQPATSEDGPETSRTREIGSLPPQNEGRDGASAAIGGRDLPPEGTRIVSAQSIPAPQVLQIGNNGQRIAEAVQSLVAPERAENVETLRESARRTTSEAPVREIRIELRPVELGSVIARIRSVDGQLAVAVEVERPDSLNTLRAERDTILASLRGLGLSVEEVVVTQMQHGQQAAQDQGGGRQNNGSAGFQNQSGEADDRSGRQRGNEGGEPRRSFGEGDEQRRQAPAARGGTLYI